MAKQLTADDARESLTAHVAARGAEICAKYGPGLGWNHLQQILQDRAFVRYPCEIRFDSAPLQPGEFAHPLQKGERPEDGFIIYVHPIYMIELSCVPYLVLYQLVAVNYGDFAGPDEAEEFGANALGLSRDDYYAAVCELADRLAPEVETEPGPVGGCGGGCHCG